MFWVWEAEGAHGTGLALQVLQSLVIMQPVAAAVARPLRASGCRRLSAPGRSVSAVSPQLNMPPLSAPLPPGPSSSRL